MRLSGQGALIYLAWLAETRADSGILTFLCFLNLMQSFIKAQRLKPKFFIVSFTVGKDHRQEWTYRLLRLPLPSLYLSHYARLTWLKKWDYIPFTEFYVSNNTVSWAMLLSKSAEQSHNYVIYLPRESEFGRSSHKTIPTSQQFSLTLCRHISRADQPRLSSACDGAGWCHLSQPIAIPSTVPTCLKDWVTLTFV